MTVRAYDGIDYGMSSITINVRNKIEEERRPWIIPGFEIFYALVVIICVTIMIKLYRTHRK